jgi:transcriptional regulator with XRE-family HTH domain
MDIKQKFGNKVKEIRSSKGISQEKLAELASLHRTYISSVELGQRNVSLVNIERLAKALQCEIHVLFEESNLKKS